MRPAVVESAPLSYEQRRLWFLDRWITEKPTYNVPVLWRWTGPVDAVRLGQVVRQVLARHDALFTAVVEVDGVPRQQVRADRVLTVPTVDLTGVEPDRAATLLAEDVAQRSRTPFDLATGPLVTAVVYVLPDRSCRVLTTFHHIAADGWSLEVLHRQLVAAYATGTAAEPRAGERYVDYAEWQRGRLSSAAVEQQVRRWADLWRDAPPLVELPRDFPRPAEFTHRGETVRSGIDPGLRREVAALAETLGVTPYVVLLAAFAVLVHRETGQLDVVVGSPAAGRTNPRFSDAVGLFVNTMLVRVRVDGGLTFGQVVERTRDSVLAGLEHLDLPFDFLVDRLEPERTTVQVRG